MNDSHVIKKAKLCDLLVRRNGLNCEEIQSTIQISRRTVFKYLGELRSMGAEIKYDKTSNKYNLLNKSFDVFEHYKKYYM